MRKMWRILILLQVCGIVSLVQAEILYNIVDLGLIDGSTSTFPEDINNNGQVVGWCEYDNGSRQGFLWESDQITGLGALSGKPQSSAFGINDSGQIVGHSWNVGNNDDQLATLFDASGGGNNVNLGTLGGNKSTAIDINNNGQIVGISKIPNHSYYFAASFDISGNQQNILIGPAGSNAQSINNNGLPVGSALYDRYHGMVFDITGGNTYVDMGGLSGWDNAARSVNDSGLIVGEVQSGSNLLAAIFDETGSGTILTLGTLGGNESKAKAINNNGQIVGWAYTGSNELHATLFDGTGSGQNIDLNSVIDQMLDWELTYAKSINDQGWIVGEGYIDGQAHGFLLTPVPEPATIVIFGLCAIFLPKKGQK